jgi:hypothetical protein
MAKYVLFFKQGYWYLCDNETFAVDCYDNKTHVISSLNRWGYRCLSNPAYSTQFWGK